MSSRLKRITHDVIIVGKAAPPPFSALPQRQQIDSSRPPEQTLRRRSRANSGVISSPTASSQGLS